MCAVRAEILTIRWSRCHFVTFFSQPFLPFLYLRTCALHDNVAARRIGAQGLESQVLEGTPQVAGVEFLIDTAAAYNLQRTANRHELAPLYSHRLSEINNTIMKLTEKASDAKVRYITSDSSINELKERIGTTDNNIEVLIVFDPV